jgi:hypothetical protein
MSELADWQYDEAMSDYAEDLKRRAAEHVERHGRQALELVPPRRFGEEPEEIEPDHDLERAVHERIRDLRVKLLQPIRAPRGHCAPRRDRRLSGGRPRVRTSRRSSSSTSSRGDPDSDEPPPADVAGPSPDVFPWVLA